MTNPGKNGRMMQQNGQLPLWPDHIRGLPWPAIRSALFAPVRPGARAALESVPIATVAGIDIVFTGLRLDQSDLDVYEQVLHLARLQKLGDVIEFTQRGFLKSIGRNCGKSDRTWLRKSLRRLSATNLTIEFQGENYNGSLIDNFRESETTGRYHVKLDRGLSRLFQAGWSANNPEIGRALGRHQLAKWLWRFGGGLHKPLTFRLERLAELSGSSYSRPRDYRARLIDAVDAVNAHTDMRITLTWSMDASQVTIAVAKQALSTPEGG